MLDNFRKIDIIWDKATRKIYNQIRVASSDDQGRKLVVQVIDDGIIENLTNVDLRLYWENSETKGFNDFISIDVSKGVFEIYFSRTLLSNLGLHKAWLHLTDPTGSVTSEPFGIEVFNGIDLEAIEDTEEFSALNDALVRIANLEGQYAPRLTTLESDVSNQEARIENVENKTKDTTYTVGSDIFDFKKTPTVNGKQLLWFGTVTEIED